MDEESRGRSHTWVWLAIGAVVLVGVGLYFMAHTSPGNTSNQGTTTTSNGTDANAPSQSSVLPSTATSSPAGSTASSAYQDGLALQQNAYDPFSWDSSSTPYVLTDPVSHTATVLDAVPLESLTAAQINQLVSWQTSQTQSSSGPSGTTTQQGGALPG